MPFEDDEETGSLEGGSQDQLTGAQTFGYSSSRGAANPYTGQLQTLLTKYLEQTEKSATDKQALLDKARERVMARSAGPDQAEMAFRVAAALGKPTRTGGFGETLGNVAETTSDVLSQRRKASQELEDLNLKYQLAAADVKGEGQKAQIGALSALARSTPKDRLTEVEKMQEILEDPKASDSAKKNAQSRINYLTTRGGGTSEIDRIVSAINDPSTTPAAKTAYQARLRKLTYIAPEAKAERDKDKPQSAAGKMAADEGLTPGTPEFAARVKQLAGEGKGMNLSATEQKELFEAEDIVNASKGVILNLTKAKEISPKAYEGFGAGVRRTVARNIPGVGGSEGVTSTTDLESLVGQNALDQLKTIFGGNPTEGERKILLDLQGSLSMSDTERQAIFDRAIKAAARRLKTNQTKMENIKKGSYGKIVPEANADGGFVGNYADGGVVEHYLTGGGVGLSGGPSSFWGNGSAAEVSSTPLAKKTSAAAGALSQAISETPQFTAGPGSQDFSGFGSQAAYDKAVADESARRAAEKAHLDSFSIAPDSPFYSAAQGLSGAQLDNLKNQAMDLAERNARRQTISDLYPGSEFRIAGGYLGHDPAANETNNVISGPSGARYLTNDEIAAENAHALQLLQNQGYYQKPEAHANGGIVGMADGGDYSLANFGRAVGQGLGLGFGDEAIARVRAQMEGRPYDQVVKEEREAYQQFQEKHPFAALGTELVSGAVPTVAMAMVPGAGTPGAVVGSARMGQAAQKFMQYLPKFMTGPMGKAAGTAAATGAVAGAGSETEGNRTSGALTGGATGAVLGPTVAKGMQLTGQAASAVKNAIRPSGNAVEQRATNKVLEAMGRDEMDTQALRDKMAADRKLGVSSTVMDATPSLSTLGEAVVTRPGSGRKILGQGLNERLESGRENVGARTLKDVAKGVDYTAQEDTLVGKLRANANNLYDAAYSHGAVDDPRIQKVLQDDTFKKAFTEARAIADKEARAAELRGEDPSRFKLKDLYELDPSDNTLKFTGTQLPDVRTLDYVKRGIDALIDKGYKGEGMSKAEANALKDLKKAFVGAIDENVPEYAKARAKYAGDMEVLDALRLGRTDYLTPKMLPAEAKKLVDGMSDAERDALRAGAAQAILTKIMDAPQQVNAAQRVIGAPATRKRLEALFQDPNEYQVFEAALQRESELFRNAQDIVRGSRTANKTEALKDLKAGNGIFDIAGEAVDVAAGSPGSVVGRVLKYLQARTTLDEKTATEVAKMLKSGTQQEVDDTLNRLESSSAKFLEDKNKSARRLKTTAGTIGAAAPTTRKAAPESDVPVDEEEDDEAKVQRIVRSLDNE